MSKLSRYKKPVAIKLPRKLDNVNASKPKPKSNLLSDSEDDDFMQPVSKILSSSTEKSKSRSGSGPTHPNKSSSPALINQYFLPKSSNYGNVQQTEPKPSTSTSASLTETTTIATSSSRTRERREGESETNDIDKIPQFQNQDQDIENQNNEPNQVVCPFCWKKLNDKLSGTTHVKACAKNLPTNQIFEALQLQDKQIKEWEKLGIAYPGFVGGTTANTRKPRTTATNRAPRQRKKKQDPELELAIALSESLHEEVQRRTEKENNFIVTHGLEKEIELRVLTLADSKKDVVVQPQHPQPQLSSKVTRRGKKVNLLELPLYKSTDSDRKASVERKLNVIFDENDIQTKEKEFSIREAIPVSSLKHSSNFISTKNQLYEKTSLWNVSASEEPMKDVNQSFIIPAFLESKQRESSHSNIQTKTISDITSRTETEDFGHMPFKEGPRKQEEERKLNKKIMPRSRLSQNTVASGNSNRLENDPSTSTQDEFNVNANAPSQLVKDLLRMYVSKEDADLTVFGREEKAIKCHKFIVKARCRNLLQLIAQEENNKGVKRDIISLTDYSHNAVKAFVKFLYCDQIKITSQLSTQDLEDLSDLGRQFKIRIPINAPIPENYENASTSNEVNKENVANKSAIGQQEREAPPPPFKKRCDRNRSLAASRKSIDLFANSDDEDAPTVDHEGLLERQGQHKDNGPEQEQEKQKHKPMTQYDSCNKASVLAPPKDSYANRDEDNKELIKQNEVNEVIDVSDGEGDGSVDMFENYDDAEFDAELEDQFDELLVAAASKKPDQSSEKNAMQSQPQSEQNIENDHERGFLEHEFLSQFSSEKAILFSPKPYDYKQKRTRSESPAPAPVFSRTGAYTASQMADFVDYFEDFQTSHTQANKKQKFDCEIEIPISESEKTFDDANANLIDSIEELLSPSEATIVHNSNSHAAANVDYDNVKNCVEKVLVTAKNKPKSSLVPVASACSNAVFTSTPLPSALGSNSKPNPFPTLLQINGSGNGNDSFDPFGNDDSYFLNIPSVLLANTNLSPIQQVSGDADADVDTDTPVNKRKSQSRIPPRQLLADDPPKSSHEGLNVNIDNEVNKNDKKKYQRKTKTLSKNISFSQQPTTNRAASLSGSPPRTSSEKSNGLDYSTIDTPLLKKELKRYGLKPLPRSKAKVILRHIDRETKK